MTKQPDNLFNCPNCQARYKLVRVAGDDINFDGQITCRSCGAPLQGREGKDILLDLPISAAEAANGATVNAFTGGRNPGTAGSALSIPM